MRSTVSRVSTITSPLVLAIILTLFVCASLAAEPIHIRLNPDPVPGSMIKYYAIAPSGESIAYIADQEKLEIDELFIIPTNGDSVQKLSPELVEGGDVRSFLFSPDGSRIIYYADQAIDNRFSIYSVPTTGGSPTDLIGELPKNQHPIPMLNDNMQPISPNSQWLIYILEEIENDMPKQKLALLSTPIGHSDPITLGLGDISSFKISPNSAFVAYLSDQLYYVPIDGSAPSNVVKLLDTDEQIVDFYFSPDSEKIVYTVFSSQALSLYQSSLRDNFPLLIDVVDRNSGSYLGFGGQFSADSSKLIYAKSASTNFQLYLVSLVDSSRLLLSSSNDIPQNSVRVSSSGFSPDGKSVLVGYSARNFVAERYANIYLYSVSTFDASKTKLFGPYFAYQPNLRFSPSYDGRFVISSISFQGLGSGVLLSTELKTNSTITLNSSIKYDGLPFYLWPDNAGVIFRGKESDESPAKYFSVSLTNTKVMTVSVDKSFDVNMSLYTPGPFINQEDVCLVYGFPQLDGLQVKELYSSCITSMLTNKVYMPIVIH